MTNQKQTAKKIRAGEYEYKGFTIHNISAEDDFYNWSVMKNDDHNFGDSFDTKKECMEAVDHWLTFIEN